MSYRFAVIGLPITHSLSPVIHQYFAQQTQVALSYEKILGDTALFEQQVSDFFTSDGKGLNVTLPFKERAFAMADEHTERCKRAFAANTLWMKDGALWADNTDGIGLIRDLSQHLDLAKKKILVLGAGGAARGILGPLLDAHPHSLVVANRTAARAQALAVAFPPIQCLSLSDLKDSYDLVINATSAGVQGASLLVPEVCFKAKPFCYDLSYDLKGDTEFVRAAKEFGCQARDGLGMLVEQAAEAFYIWNGIRPLTAPALDFLHQ